MDDGFDNGIILGLFLGMAFMGIVMICILMPSVERGVYHDICTQVNGISTRAVYKVVGEGWYWDIQGNVEGPFRNQEELVETLLDYTVRDTWNLRLDSFYIDVSSLQVGTTIQHEFASSAVVFSDSVYFPEEVCFNGPVCFMDSVYYNEVDVMEGWIYVDRLGEVILTVDSGVVIIDPDITTTADLLVLDEIVVDPYSIDTYHFPWNESSQLIVNTLSDGQLELVVTP